VLTAVVLNRFVLCNTKLSMKTSLTPTGWKVANASPDKVIHFFNLIFPYALWPQDKLYGDQKLFLGSKTRPARKADDFSVICNLTV
jgi:hypothetical protein